MTGQRVDDVNRQMPFIRFLKALQLGTPRKLGVLGSREAAAGGSRGPRAPQRQLGFIECLLYCTRLFTHMLSFCFLCHFHQNRCPLSWKGERFVVPVGFSEQKSCGARELKAQAELGVGEHAAGRLRSWDRHQGEGRTLSS